MARSSYKQNYYHTSIWNKIFKVKLNLPVKGRLIFTRSSNVPAELYHQTFIYNGKIFKKFTSSIATTNQKYGEFSVTKKPFYYLKKDKKKR